MDKKWIYLMFKLCKCGQIIKNFYAKRCRNCYLISPNKGYSHNFSKQELQKRSDQMRKGRKSGKICTWNKNINLTKLYPEIGINLSKKLKGRRCNLQGEFKKGHEISLKRRAKLINKHHIDLDKFNNQTTNLLYLTNSDHNKLHKRAYNYLVETNQIDNYTSWFLKKFHSKMYNAEEYKIINKQIVLQLRKEKNVKI